MAIALAFFALLIMALSLYGALFPAQLTALVTTAMGHPAGMAIAVLARVVLAILLWFAAPQSRTPLAFQVLAVLALVAALVLPFIGRARILALMRRVAAWPAGGIRPGCLVGVAFGGFLFWAVYPVGLAV